MRSSELETGLSSSEGPVEGDTVVSVPRSVRAFYALGEECGLEADTVARFKDRFQFLARVRVRRPVVRIGPATSSLVKYASTRLLSLVGLGYPSIRW